MVHLPRVDDESAIFSSPSSILEEFALNLNLTRFEEEDPGGLYHCRTLTSGHEHPMPWPLIRGINEVETYFIGFVGLVF